MQLQVQLQIVAGEAAAVPEAVAWLPTAAVERLSAAGRVAHGVLCLM